MQLTAEELQSVLNGVLEQIQDDENITDKGTLLLMFGDKYIQRSS